MPTLSAALLISRDSRKGAAPLLIPAAPAPTEQERRWAARAGNRALICRAKRQRLGKGAHTPKAARLCYLQITAGVRQYFTKEHNHITVLSCTHTYGHAGTATGPSGHPLKARQDALLSAPRPSQPHSARTARTSRPGPPRRPGRTAAVRGAHGAQRAERRTSHLRGQTHEGRNPLHSSEPSQGFILVGAAGSHSQLKQPKLSHLFAAGPQPHEQHAVPQAECGST